MQRHSVKIIAFLDRATGICTCGFSTREKFGDRRTANAKQSLLTHIESAFASDHTDYQIKDGSDLVCPICHAELDLASNDKGLLQTDQPSAIACEEGHDFDAYYKDRTLFLFVNDYADGPFST